MVRKVGFGQYKAPETPVTRRHDKRHNRIASSHALKHPHSIAEASPSRRPWIAIIFLSVWLFFWSVAILLVGAVSLTEDSEPFLLVWLAVAIFFWIGALTALIRLIRLSKQKNRS